MNTEIISNTLNKEHVTLKVICMIRQTEYKNPPDVSKIDDRSTLP